MTLKKAKAAARKAGHARRSAAHEIHKTDASGRLAEVLAGYRGVPLSGYMPIRTEIDPLPVMHDAAAHGPVGVPVIIQAGHPLKFALWEPETAMVAGPFGAEIPAEPVWMDPEILIVPLIAFTRSGSRLGYGGGFYDRTLQGLRARGSVLAIGFAYGAQEAATLPYDPNDQPLDMIITEDAIIQCARD